MQKIGLDGDKMTRCGDPREREQQKDNEEDEEDLKMTVLIQSG